MSRPPDVRTAVAADEPEPCPLVSPVLLTTGTATTVGDPGLLITTTATATAQHHRTLQGRLTWTASEV